MPNCYLLALTAGSSLDQGSNNITLFSLVEQINLRPGTSPPPGHKIPLEIHAYFRLDGREMGQSVSIRFALVGQSGLETYTDTMTHRVATARFRTRSVGLPSPAALGQYDLRVEFRLGEDGDWTRDPISWPIAFVESNPSPPITH